VRHEDKDQALQRLKADDEAQSYACVAGQRRARKKAAGGQGRERCMSLMCQQLSVGVAVVVSACSHTLTRRGGRSGREQYGRGLACALELGCGGAMVLLPLASQLAPRAARSL
jgi:hypothetical protein